MVLLKYFSGRFLILILAVAFTATGCSEPNHVTLRIGTGHAAGPAVYATQLRDFLVPEIKRRVSEETDYEIEFIEAYGGTIAKVAETLEAVQSGVLDIGAYCVCFEPAKLFLHNFSYYVPFGPRDSRQAIQVAREVYRLHPWLEDQLVQQYQQQLLALNGWDNYHLGTTQPWTSVKDLEKVKIAGAGPNLPWLDFSGAVPVQSTLPEGYLSLQTGVYDGWLMFPSAYYSFKFHEPAPHYTLVNFGAVGGAVVLTINSQSMDSLPVKIQQIIREVGQEYEVLAAQALNDAQASGLSNLAKAGASIRELPEAMQKEWAVSLASFPAQMARDANARNMPGTKVITSYINEVTKSGHKWPVNYTVD